MEGSGTGTGSGSERFRRAAKATALDDAVLPESRPVVPVGGATLLADSAVGAEQRILLGTDATVVRFLEGCFDEPIRTASLSQVSTPPLPTDAELELTGDETVLRRETLLRGSHSGRNYVYAEAAVVLDRVAPAVREGLLSTSEAIGHLLIANRVESFRELVSVGRMPAGPLADRFGLDSSDELLSRTYRIVMGGRPALLISEYFPPRFNPEAGDSHPGGDLAIENGS